MLKVNLPTGLQSAQNGFVVAGRNCLAWYGSVAPATRQRREGRKDSKLILVCSGQSIATFPLTGSSGHSPRFSFPLLCHRRWQKRLCYSAGYICKKTVRKYDTSVQCNLQRLRNYTYLNVYKVFYIVGVARHRQAPGSNDYGRYY